MEIYWAQTLFLDAHLELEFEFEHEIECEFDHGHDLKLDIGVFNGGCLEASNPNIVRIGDQRLENSLFWSTGISKIGARSPPKLVGEAPGDTRSRFQKH